MLVVGQNHHGSLYKRREVSIDHGYSSPLGLLDHNFSIRSALPVTMLESPTRVSPLPLVHKDTYPSLSASHKPSLSQAGKTVLITGGGAGVGFFIARQFAKAGSSRIILVGRRQHVLESAAEQLRSENPTLTEYVHFKSVDVTDQGSTAALWAWIGEQGITIDVLVLGHGRPSPMQSILEMGLKAVWEYYEINVKAYMDFTEKFWKHLDDVDKNLETRPTKGPAVLINVSTAGIWDYISCGPVPVYSVTKNSGTMLLQQTAKDVDPEKLRIVSYHPGLIKTDATKDLFPMGYTVPWDTPELAGDFAVWLASPDAGFLHGRFVQSSWDVNELCGGEMRAKMDNDPFFLQVGVLGFHP
ncbi:putative short chain dehydrogenase [Naviculisporaceae sp. PSN 640]